MFHLKLTNYGTHDFFGSTFLHLIHLISSNDIETPSIPLDCMMSLQTKGVRVSNNKDMRKWYNILNKTYRKMIHSSKFKLDRDRRVKMFQVTRSSRRKYNFDDLKVLFIPPKQSELYMTKFDRDSMSIDPEFIEPLLTISSFSSTSSLKQRDKKFLISTKLFHDNVDATNMLQRLRDDLELYRETIIGEKNNMRILTSVHEIHKRLVMKRHNDLKHLETLRLDRRKDFVYLVGSLMSKSAGGGGGGERKRLEHMILVSSRVAQISRALVLSSRILKCEDKVTRECLVSELSRELSTKRTCSNPKFIVFEFAFNMILRKCQVEIVKDFVKSALDGQSSCRQMIMGAGKTTVVSPLVVLFLADGTSLRLFLSLSLSLRPSSSPIQTTTATTRSNNTLLRKQTSSTKYASSTTGNDEISNAIRILINYTEKNLHVSIQQKRREKYKHTRKTTYFIQ
jgi:hypothetical protein